MRPNLFVRIFVLFVLACGVYAVAQDVSDTNITGSGTTNKIPRFTGTHKIGNSIMQQAGTTIDVAGGVKATGAISGAGVSSTSTITAGGVISGASDVDASGNVNVTGWVDSQSFIQAVGEVYAGTNVYSPGDVEAPYVYGDTEVSTPAVYSNYNSTAGEGWFQNPGSGIGIGASDTDGLQVIQTQCLAASGYEISSFNSSATLVFNVDCAGDTYAAGTKSAIVPLKNGKMVAVYSQESPQVWFEDFGSSNLVGGVATVQLESKYAQLVNTKLPYHVFLTPNGDCHGLYVVQKDPNSFEVRELDGGQSSVGFDYRISALRNGYEKLRLEPAKLATLQNPPKTEERPQAHQPPAAPKR
jgi:hypothetical protein